MLTIAILALIGFVTGIAWDIFISYMDDDVMPSPRCFLSAILVITWWDISFPFAIVLLVLACIWLIISLGAYAGR